MSKNTAVKQAAPMTQTPAQYEEFQASVLEAAREQAQRILSDAQRESDAAYRAALSSKKGDPVAAHRTENEAALRRKIAAAQQENLRMLLVYRKQLVNGLFAEAEEALEEFTTTAQYPAFLGETLTPHAAKVGAQPCTVLLRGADMTQANRTALCAVLPQATFEADPTITLGGAKLLVGRVVYDETLDERLRAQHAAFLTRCKLHVAAPRQEVQA